MIKQKNSANRLKWTKLIYRLSIFILIWNVILTNAQPAAWTSYAFAQISGYTVSLSPMQSYILLNQMACLYKCAFNTGCTVASFTAINGSCLFFNLTANNYAFASPGTNLFRKQQSATGSTYYLYYLISNYTSGLVNYWPVVSNVSTVLDVMTNKQLTASSQTFATDKWGNLNGVIGVRASLSTFWTLPAAVYFTSDFTIIAWVKVYACLNSNNFMDCGNGQYADNIKFSLSSATTCTPYIFTANGGTFNGNVLTSYVTPTNGTWVHLAWSLAGTTGQVYANGQSIAANAACTAIRSVTRTQCFFGQGSWYSSGDAISNADFDEIKFFDRALSQAEIQYDYNSIQSFMRQF